MRITQPLQRNVQQQPDTIATIFGDRKRTWREHGERVQRLAGGLRSIGLQENDRVGVIGLNSDLQLELFYATPWAGGVIVPINHRWAAPEIAYALNDSETKILFIDETFGELASALPDLVNHDLTIVTIDGPRPSGVSQDLEGLIAANEPIEEVERAPEDLSGIFYTGGTTGRSKGVMLTHANHVANSLQLAATGGITTDSIYLHAAPMFHIADGLYIYAITQLGGQHVIIPRFEPEACATALEKYRINVSILVPTMIQMLLDYPGLGDCDLSEFATLYYGASPMPEATLLRLFEALPECGPIQLYGQTESAPLLTFMSSDYHTTDGPFAGKLRSAGCALPCVELKIVDDNDQEKPRGEVGEIICRAPNVMKGYWKMPEQSAETLRNGWLHTGDAAFMDDDGYIYISDRLKDMIISGGENVYSTEVENAVYQHPDVAQCAVIGIPDDKWGERVHAIVVKKPDATCSAEDIMKHCRELIADFKCPRSVDFHGEPLPLSGAGKILKTELRKPYWGDSNRQVN
ncbi:MAG: long-chain fatty acid--CoA ligase [Pseudomonadota bacterium]